MSNEINVGAISEALNNKVDLNQLNTNEQGLEYVSGLSMPSDRYINLTLGANNTEYTAPANGYYCISQNVTQDKYLRLCVMLNGMEYYAFRLTAKSSNIWGDYILPVKKGDIVKLQYSGITGSTNAFFRFIYAQGESEE